MNNNMNQINMMGNQMIPQIINNMNQIPMMNMNQMPMMNMNQMQMVNHINSLIKKNKSLEEKLNALEKKFQDYQNKMEKILFYNEIDPNSYTLDIIFNDLISKEIIKTKEELRLINKGIKHLFNRNIISLESKYKSKVEDFDPLQFKRIFNNISYSLLIICTKKGEKRFGAFYNYNNQIMGRDMRRMKVMNKFSNLNRDDDIIFDSKSSLNEYFIFSLNNLSMYYKEKDIDETVIPDFQLKYNRRYESLLGNEFPIKNNEDPQYNNNMNNNMGMNNNMNNDMDMNNMNKNNILNMNNNNKIIKNNNLYYKLTGNEEFKVKSLELYEIII